MPGSYVGCFKELRRYADLSARIDWIWLDLFWLDLIELLLILDFGAEKRWDSLSAL